MSASRTIPPATLLHIAKLLNVPAKGLKAVTELLDEGATVPFIARYRKEATGNLDEVQIRDIQEKLEYFRELQDRRETVLASIQAQGKLTARIEDQNRSGAGESRTRRFVPALQAQAPDQGLHCPRQRTRAARAVPLEPVRPHATGGGRRRIGLPPDEALEGARHIVAEMISESAAFRKRCAP